MLLFIAGIPTVFAHGAEGDSNETAAFSADKLKACISLESGRAECYVSLCNSNPGYFCAEDVLDASVVAAGPEKAMMVLHDVMQSPDFSISTDGHLLAHVIGRSLSKNFGPTGENFLRCPSDFNNGCFHGFFEDTLVKVSEPVDVAVNICESLPDGAPYKEKWYCYHGAGHVFMMNENYDLNRSLELCLSLNDSWPKACWQGVFMENAGERDWELKKKNFRESDPLYPCTVVEERFKPECYLNHHGYLNGHYSTSWDSLTEVCMGAGEHTKHCLGGLGVMLSSPAWVNVVSHDFSIAHMSHEEKIVFLCNRFPEEHVDVCYKYVVLRFLNFDLADLNRITRMCSMAEPSHRQACFGWIGSYFPRVIPDEGEREASCASVPEEYRDGCVGKDSHEPGDNFVSPDASDDSRRGLFFDRFSFPKNKRYFFLSLFEFLRDHFGSPDGSGETVEIINPYSERHVKKTNGTVIRYVSGSYVPDVIHVYPGSKVVWVNEDDAFWPASNLHPTHTAYPGSGITKCHTSERNSIFDACEALGPGAEYSFVFHNPGKWRFHDHINPRATGTVIVSE